jgi:hypothetical protein
MSTLQQTMFENHTAIRNWIENCRKNGTSILNCGTVRAAMKKSYLQEEDLAFYMRDEYNFDIVSNKIHYILSITEVKKIY